MTEQHSVVNLPEEFMDAFVAEWGYHMVKVWIEWDDPAAPKQTPKVVTIAEYIKDGAEWAGLREINTLQMAAMIFHHSDSTNVTTSIHFPKIGFKACLQLVAS